MKTWIPIAVGSTKRQRCRREGYVREDVERMNIQNWTEMTMGRAVQNIIFEHAETHK
jgi:hypothetical protein